MVKYCRFCDEPSDYPRPKKLFRSSIIEFDPNKGEEIFLTYTHGRENGPGIVRTGMGPPYMARIGGAPGESTTHPFGQRLGSWLIQDELRKRDINEAKKKVKDIIEEAYKEVTAIAREASKTEIDSLLELLDYLAKAVITLSEASKTEIDSLLADVSDAKTNLSNAFSNAFPSGVHKADIDLLLDYLVEAGTIQAHDRFFADKYQDQDYEIIGQQGCGDLTMNRWNVAYINSPLAKDPPVLIYLFDEPLEKMIYSCLVKWTPGRGPHGLSRYELTIEDVQFNRFARSPNDKVFIHKKVGREPKGDDIEFAVYGKQIIRDGKVVDISRITHEFSDLRHLVLMPNLNPKIDELFKDEPRHPDGRCRPRFYFGTLQEENVWLGEALLLARTNEQRLACLGPIILSRLSRGMGASEKQIRGALEKEGYETVNDPRQDLTEGQFRFVPQAPTIVEVYFKRNTYGWTMIGLPKNNDKILCLACEGDPGEKIGCTLEHAAEMLIDAGAHNGLLIDEGFDVFQKAQLGWGSLPKAKVAGGGELDVTVPKGAPNKDPPLKRTRLRATFIFAKKKPA